MKEREKKRKKVGREGGRKEGEKAGIFIPLENIFLTDQGGAWAQSGAPYLCNWGLQCLHPGQLLRQPAEQPSQGKRHDS